MARKLDDATAPSTSHPRAPTLRSGGSCSDGETIRAVSDAHRKAIQAAGGVWYLILKYAFARYAGDCDAFFNPCGGRRALEVAHAAGFGCRTETPDRPPALGTARERAPRTRRQGRGARSVLIRPRLPHPCPAHKIAGMPRLCRRIDDVCHHSARAMHP